MRALIVIVLAVLRDLIALPFELERRLLQRICSYGGNLPCTRKGRLAGVDRHPPAKLALVILGRFFPWAPALAIVQSSTFVRWHRAGFRLFWRWKSRTVGRPPLPKNLRTLILTMAGENPSWGEGRIADELSLKLGLLVDARTVGKYLKQASRPRRPRNQRWATFCSESCE